jgi:hypothetical protein
MVGWKERMRIKVFDWKVHHGIDLVAVRLCILSSSQVAANGHQCRVSDLGIVGQVIAAAAAAAARILYEHTSNRFK